MIDALIKENAIEDEKLGLMVIDTTYDPEYKYQDWKYYMEKNPILLGKVGDVVIPMGTNLEKGQSRTIENMNFSMIIENGEGYTGYGFLHGTHMNVGGFQIDGKVKKFTLEMLHTI